MRDSLERVAATAGVLAAAFGLVFVAVPGEMSFIQRSITLSLLSVGLIALAGGIICRIWMKADTSTAAAVVGITIGVNAEAVFAMWDKYEQVAMHFNELMMRWRLQGIGGLATLVTLAGFVVREAGLDEPTRYRAMFILGVLLLCAWLSVGFIDLVYYRRLLKGAVAALINLENGTSDLKLSTKIEAAAGKSGLYGPIVFYVMGLLPLIGIVWWAFVNIRRLGLLQG